MGATGAALAVRGLEDEGIPFAFGIPGTHNIELYDELAVSDSVRPVLVTDERSASFMADGVWRASGRMACVNVVPGAGLTHALSGIAEAFMDTVPMLVLGCGIRRDTDKAYQLHDVDQTSMAAPVVKETFRPERGDEIYATLRTACRVARSGAPGPVFVEIPADLYLRKHDVSLPATSSRRTGPPPGPGAAPDAVARAVEVLREARRPLIYAGLGARNARSELLTLAERLEAPVSTTFQGKGVFPERHPLFLWPGFGRSAPPFVQKVAGDCDATLAVGCRFSEVATGTYGLEPPGPLVHVDIDPEVPGRNFPARVAATADAGDFLGALLEALGEDEREPNARLRSRIRDGHREVREAWARAVGGEGVTPAHLLSVLQETLGDEAIYATDSGNGTFLAMECLRLERPGQFLAPVDYSCMGYSVPAALGAALARPNAPVVALAGDGAFLMTGLEVLGGVREGAEAMIFVLRDRELGQIAQFQEMALNRKAQSEVPNYDLESLAAAVGAPFQRLDADERVPEVVEEARRLSGEEKRPVLVDVAIDYSQKTYFTRGVVRSSLLRLPVREQARFMGRALLRRFTG